MKTESREPEFYAKLRRVSSKWARENLPRLMDDVVDTGEPVLMTKLDVSRTALVPARELWLLQAAKEIGLDSRQFADRPLA